MSDETSDAGVVRDVSPAEAVLQAAQDGKISILQTGGEQVAVLPASSPWVNGLRTALREEQEGNDER